MNDRIKELSKQAEIYALTLVGREDDYVEVFEQKFAELIVQECAKLQHRNVIVGGVSEYNRGRREFAEDILKHFGVE